MLKLRFCMLFLLANILGMGVSVYGKQKKTGRQSRSSRVMRRKHRSPRRFRNVPVGVTEPVMIAEVTPILYTSVTRTDVDQYIANRNLLISAFLEELDAMDSMYSAEALQQLAKLYQETPYDDLTAFKKTLLPMQKVGIAVWRRIGRTIQCGVGPYLAADAAVFTRDNKLVVIARPGRGLRALPGGFIEVDQEGGTAEETAGREFWEEVGAEAGKMEQVAYVDTPGRDPRSPIATVLFAGPLKSGTPHVTPEAEAVYFMTESEIRAMPAKAFYADHKELMLKAFEYWNSCTH